MNDLNRPQKKKKRIFLIIFLVIIGIAAALAAAAFALWLSGRSAMNKENEAIVLPVFDEPEDDAREAENIEEPAAPRNEILDEYTIRRGDKLYRQKKNVKTFLLLGIDKYSTDEDADSKYRADARADLLMLAILDTDANRTSFLAIPRDTMCSLETYDKNGEYTGTARGQIALAYRYGDGGVESCALTADAVSGFLYNITINASAAVYLDGIGVINDAVGGVTLTPIESVEGIAKKGEEVTLDGYNAMRYVRSRDLTEYGNLKRMDRQRQYFKALLKQLFAKVKADPSSVLNIYSAIDDYLETDLGVNEIVYLATQAVQTELSGKIWTLPGEITLSEDNYAQYIMDEKLTSDVIIELYYEEVK